MESAWSSEKISATISLSHARAIRSKQFYQPSFKFSGVCIATGYNVDRLGGKRVSYELVKEYEQKALELVYDYTQTNKRDALNTLIDEFIEKAIAEKTK